MTEQRLNPAAVPRDWRDTFRDAADLALLGMLVTLFLLPVVTAGAAVAVASEAIHTRFTEGRWLGPTQLWQALRRRLLPGAVAGPIVLLTVVLLIADLTLVGNGSVPGGTALAWVTGIFGLVVLSTFGLTAGMLGRGLSFRAALGAARLLVLAKPGKLCTAAAALLIAALLIWVLPVTAPLLAGYLLLAFNALTR